MIAPFQVIDERYSVINNNSCNDDDEKNVFIFLIYIAMTQRDDNARFTRRDS